MLQVEYCGASILAWDQPAHAFEFATASTKSNDCSGMESRFLIIAPNCPPAYLEDVGGVPNMANGLTGDPIEWYVAKRLRYTCTKTLPISPSGVPQMNDGIFSQGAASAAVLTAEKFEETDKPWLADTPWAEVQKTCLCPHLACNVKPPTCCFAYAHGKRPCFCYGS